MVNKLTSYGRNFKKVGKNKWRDKKSGTFTTTRHLKAARTMRKKFGGTFGEWQKKLRVHNTRRKKWNKGERDIEPILEYD